MADNVGPTPVGTPPEDHRPRPQYGELAPEGWTWKPPKVDPVETAPTPAQPAQTVPNASPNGPPGREARAVPKWDPPVTLGLLVFGLLATFFTVSVLGTLPDAIQVLYTQQDLGTYTPDPSVTGLLTAGSIAEVVTWLVTAAISILLMVRGKRAFYLPLIGAVVSFLVIFVFMSIVLATDPTLLDFYNRP